MSAVSPRPATATPNPTVMTRLIAAHSWEPSGAISEQKGAAARRIAKPIDFQANRPIFVRNRLAVCHRFEYPLVYWSFQGDDIEKHRSFSADPDQFMVYDTENSTEHPQTTALQNARETTNHGDTEQHTTDDNPFEDGPESTSVVFSQKRGENLMVVDAKEGMDVTLSECQDCMLKLPEEVKSLTIRNCRNVRASFAVVAESCVVENSVKSVLHCSVKCTKYVVTNSPGTKVKFPKSSPVVEWLTTRCNDTSLEALNEEGEPSATMVTGAPLHEKSAVSTFHTRYTNGVFQKPVAYLGS
eukprot:gb/GEZN01012965.1/.p1 GENE.gb/GEZN01012965.1/~~gb/GEZN01012965.1/.p1  ORF type:complete len:299 (-),score=17.43 gb/GEZN01012965.1/:94-990(-)